MFRAVDGNHDGSLTRTELISALNSKTVKGRKLAKKLCQFIGIPLSITGLKQRDLFECIFECIDKVVKEEEVVVVVVAG